MRASSLFFALFGALTVAHPVSDVQVLERDDGSLPRLVIYFQTTHDSNGNPISMLPLIQEQGIALTHLIVCSFHINAGSSIVLNDHPPDDSSFTTLWSEAGQLKDAGVKIMGMIGGAATGSWDTDSLDSTDDATFETYYGQLHDTISTYGLQGMDLDVEQSMSLSGIERLINRLKTDFGSDFIVTLAPVATDLQGEGGLSGFSYDDLDRDLKDSISHYNTQFYNGWGDLSTPDNYDNCISHGFTTDRVVAGEVTSPANGSGYVDAAGLNSTVEAIVAQYGSIGGIMGWEYFNSDPGGTDAPWQWAQDMTAILRPGQVPEMKITKADADQLTAAYATSKRNTKTQSRIKDAGKVDYYKWVNA